MRFYSGTTPLRGGQARPGFFDDPGFAGVLEGLPDAAALIELDGRIRLANAALERLLKTARADLLGSDLTRHLRGADPVPGPLSVQLSEGLIRLRRVEVAGVLPPGRAVLAQLSILRNGGEPYGALLTLRELRDAAQAQAQAQGQGSRFRFAPDPAREAVRPDPFVESPARAELARRLRLALEGGLPVSLSGESGTGKAVLARRIAGRDGRPVEVVACATLDAAGFERRMTGGSGAEGAGHLRAAAGGTLVLVGLEALAPELQARLCLVLDAARGGRTLGGVGGAAGTGPALLSTSAEPLERLMARGVLSPALGYRLLGLPLHLPSLREDPEFIAPLREAWLAEITRGRAVPLSLSVACQRALAARPLRGNIRELIQALQHAALLAEEVAGPGDLPPLSLGPLSPGPLDGAAEPAGSGHLRDLVRAFELRAIERSVAEHGSKRGAAKALGIDVATLIRKTSRSREARETGPNSDGTGAPGPIPPTRRDDR